MRTATKLKAVSLAVASLGRPFQHAHRYDADLIAVFLAKQRLRADGAGIVGGHDPGLDRRVLADEGVDLGLDGLQVIGRDGRRVTEVEAQAVGGVEASPLGDVVAQGTAQRFVQKVRRGVVRPDRGAASVRNLQLCRLSFQNSTFRDLCNVDEDPGGFLHIGHFRHAGVGADDPAIAHLTAGFRVERGLVDDDLDGLAGGCLPDGSAVTKKRGDHALGGFGIVAEEFRHPMLFGDLAPDLRVARSARARPCRAGLGLLLGHCSVKALDVNLAALFAEGILREVKREAVSVIKLERRSARERGPFSETREFFVQKLQAPVEGLLELGFLAAQGLLNQRLGAGKLRVGPTHLADQRRDQTVHHWVLRAQHVGVAHRAAHDPAEDVAPALVRGHHPVGDQE